MERLQLDNQTVEIDSGELVSYRVNNHEFIHQRGSPGWRSSDTEMFPVIGPTKEADFKVATPKGAAIQDQHGLLRELSYDLITNDLTTAIYQKDYGSNTKVANSKFPEKSAADKLYWPYDFQFKKSFLLSSTGLEISFEISGEKNMPFMLGYHPAFKLYSKNPSVETDSRTISLQEVLAVGSRALQVADCNNILLKDEKSMSISTQGFGNFMLWTEVPNMICIEPITFYPYAVEAKKLHSGFDQLGDQTKAYKVHLRFV